MRPCGLALLELLVALVSKVGEINLPFPQDWRAELPEVSKGLLPKTTLVFSLLIQYITTYNVNSSSISQYR